MIVFPNCKINLGLHILQKREDGFHDLETFFVPVDLRDALEILPCKHQTELVISGLSAGTSEDNLCLKAYRLLKKDHPQLPEIRIHLHKAIPIGAGLGGGSADASFTLELLNEKFAINIPPKKMYEYALMLGSDCPFFLLNKSSLATGRGEELEEVNIALSQYNIALINPRIHISTAEAFKNIVPHIREKKIKEIINQPIERWKDELQNDFEKYAFEKYPEIRKIKEDLYEGGALYAAMSGSGSTVFGIFKKEVPVNYAPAAGYFYKLTQVIS